MGIAGALALGKALRPKPRKVLGIPTQFDLDAAAQRVARTGQQVGRIGRQVGKLAGDIERAGQTTERVGKLLAK